RTRQDSCGISTAVAARPEFTVRSCRAGGEPSRHGEAATRAVAGALLDADAGFLCGTRPAAQRQRSAELCYVSHEIQVAAGLENPRGGRCGAAIWLCDPHGAEAVLRSGCSRH